MGEHSPRHLRRITRAYLHLWSLEEVVDAAELAVTELLGNVVRHVPDRRCALRLLRLPWGVRIEVSDAWGRMPRTPAGGRPGASALDESGRGLMLVEAVADRWGVDPLPPRGKTVWCECETKRRSRC
ncbi:ATP-binding protein [Streptomyces sp. NPDC014894]|uniref:ATP-binding protein n=1 Tax=unclassified Streptomyces TaxID=2593676 RepID=UPI0037013B82